MAHNDCRKCVWFIVVCLGNAVYLGTIIFISLLPHYTKPEPPATSAVEVGGNVPVLLNQTGFDPFRYDRVQVTGLTAGSNTTLLRGLCEDLSTVRVPFRPKNIFFKSSTKSPLPFNYNGGDTPVYSAGGNGSFISFNVSAEATSDSQNYNSHQSCGAQLINFNNFTSYMEFINNQTTYQSFSLPSCLPVGPPGSPSTASVVFPLHEPGFYRQAVFVNTSLSIISSVTGSLSSYNTSSLDRVFCNTKNCTIRISTLPSTQTPRVCVLVLNDGEYTAVEFKTLGSYNIFGFGLPCGAGIVWNALMIAIWICIWQCKHARKSQTVSILQAYYSVLFPSVGIVCTYFFPLSVLCGYASGNCVCVYCVFFPLSILQA